MSGFRKIAVYTDSAVESMSDKQLSESLQYINPDVIVVQQFYHESRFRTADADTQTIALGRIPPAGVTEGPDAQVAYIRSPGDFTTLSQLEDDGTIDTDTETFVLSTELTINIDLTKLETSLDGKADYVSGMQTANLDGKYTHLTNHAGPEYQNEWGDLTVHGVLPGADETGVKPTTDIAHLSLYPDGTIAGKTISADSFGMQRLDQIGPKTADTLKEAGIRTVEDVRNTAGHRLQQLDGFGEKTSEKVLTSAKATVDGDVYRTSSETLPGRDPVFIDIETDGLSPTMVWLIGVLDAKNDQYMSFLATDPADKAKAVEGFMMWFEANAADRPLIAYNGEKFDFDVLHNHINQHCPEYVDAWQDAWLFDPYWWAVKQNNAVLPGRTNQLEDVAEALGYETDDTGLTGAVVGQRFQQWMRDPCDETELEWTAHETYCEDDVRGLKHVYDALKNAERMDGITTTNSDNDSPSGPTAQGTLSDF